MVAKNLFNIRIEVYLEITYKYIYIYIYIYILNILIIKWSIFIGKLVMGQRNILMNYISFKLNELINAT